jgi:hypothetical protein
MAVVFFVYCVIVFTAVIFAKLNSPTCNCNDTVVNWFIEEQFCNLHVWFMFIRAINPFKKRTESPQQKISASSVARRDLVPALKG